MKKSLIAVAVAAALPAAAFAQTNVQMYGIADAAIEFSNAEANGTPDDDIRMIDGLQSGSRWGVRGSEDLGGGLSATFVFEAGVDVDDGEDEAKFLGRQARVGLKGGFGEIRLGRQYTPIFYSSIEDDFTGFGWYNNHFAVAGSQGRVDNMLEYRNKFGGFEIIGAWAPGEASVVGGVPADPDDFYGVAAIYNGGVWGINGGFHDEGVQTVYQVGGKLMFGPVKLGVSYGHAEADVGTAERDDIDLSLGLKLGASGEMVLNAALIDANGVEEQQFGLSYGHALSKRTNWYISTGFVTSDNDARDGGTQVALGIRHRF